MIDINNLKYVNDSFGHEHGDEYIKGCCNIICNVYKKSPVFRIGGDEFVVILRGNDYVNRMDCFDSLEDLFDESCGNTSAEEYCRYSASFGMADYDPSTDKTVDDVFKRADKLMYDFKKEFKKLQFRP
jgi:diguanylate cyclase (GGDEF)-like protein